MVALRNTSSGDVDSIRFWFNSSIQFNSFPHFGERVAIVTVIIFVRIEKRKNTVFGACFRAYEMSCFLFFAPNPRALISFVHRFFDFSTVAKKLNYPLSTNYWSPIHLYILGSSQRRSWIHGIIPDPRAVLKH